MAEFVAVFVGDEFAHPVARVLHIELHDDGTVAVVVSEVAFDTPFQFRGFLDFAFFLRPRSDFRLTIHTHHVFTDHHGDAHQGAADGKGIPVFLGNERGAQSAGHQRDASDYSLVIRTDFSDAAAWAALGCELQAPQTEHNFTANLELISDPECEGLGPEELADLLPEDSAQKLASSSRTREP